VWHSIVMGPLRWAIRQRAGGYTVNRDPLDLERTAFWEELARAVAILGPIVALTEIGVWLLW